MPNEPVYIPVTVKVTDLDMGKVDLKDVQKGITKKLNGIKKSVNGVINTKGAVNANKAIHASTQSVVTGYKSVMSAGAKYNKVLVAAGKTSKQFQADLVKSNTELKRTKQLYTDLAADNYVASIVDKVENTDKPLSKSEAEIYKIVNSAKKEYKAAQQNVPRPEDYADSSSVASLEAVSNAYRNIMLAISDANVRGQLFNKTMESNHYSDEYTKASQEVSKVTKKLDDLDQKSRKMEALGATAKQWESLNYDASEYKHQLESIIEKMKEMVNSGKAFRFGPKRGERVKTRNELPGLGTAGAASAQNISGRHAVATTPPKLSIWEKFANIGKSLGTGLVKNLKKSSSHVLGLDKHTKKTTKSMQKSFKKLGKNLLMFGLGFRSLYYLIKRLRSIVTDNLGSMATKFDEINKPMSEILTMFNQLKGALGTFIQPVLNIILPGLKMLISYLSASAEKFGSFFAAMTGQDYIYKAIANQKDFAASVKGTDNAADYDQLKTIDGSSEVDFTKVAIDSEDINNSHGELLNTLKKFGGTIKQIFGMVRSFTSKLIPFAEALINNILPKISELFVKILPPVIELAESLFPVILDILDALLPVLVENLPIVVSLFTELAQMVLPIVVSLIQALAPILSKLASILLPILKRALVALQPIFDVLVADVLPVLVRIIDALLPIMEEMLGYFMDLLEPILALIAPLLSLIMTVLEPLLQILMPIVEMQMAMFGAFSKLLAPVVALLKPLIELVDMALKPILDLITSIVGPVFTTLCDVLTWIANMVANSLGSKVERFTSIIQWLVDKVKLVTGAFKSAFGGAEDSVESSWSVFKRVFNSILGGVETMVNGVIKAINKMIGALNGLSFTVPSWVPNIGGESFGLNLPSIKEISIPRLAQGAVLPPNREFLATLGDQRHGTNVEAPLDTIKQALIEVLSEHGGTRDPIVLQLDGKMVAKVVWSENEKRYKQTGKLATAY